MSCSRASCGASATIPLSASESSSARETGELLLGGARLKQRHLDRLGHPEVRGGPRPEAVRVAGAVRRPPGGGSDGISVSQKASRVRRCASVNSSLVASALIASPTCSVTSAE